MTAKPPRSDLHQKRYQIQQLLWRGIDWLFPPVCAGCGKATQRFCNLCMQRTPKPNPGICVLCGEKLEQPGQAHSCSRSKFIDQAYVWGLHAGPLREALHSFKYKRDLGLADTFASLLEGIAADLSEPIDLVVPVPLGPKRERERGYNQAALLAAALCGRSGLPYSRSSVRRIRETRTQVGLSVGQRRENVRGAFGARPDLVSGKSVLLVDDVLTTGATLNACAEALKQAGAVRVIGLTLARAP